MVDQAGPSDHNGRAAAIEYMAIISNNMSVIARAHGLDTLGYLFEMARLEAENLSESARDADDP